MIIVWYCPKCNWVCISNSKIRHCMDVCRCRETSLDLEEGYSRVTGFPIRLAVFDKGKWTRKRK